MLMSFCLREDGVVLTVFILASFRQSSSCELCSVRVIESKRGRVSVRVSRGQPSDEK